MSTTPRTRFGDRTYRRRNGPPPQLLWTAITSVAGIDGDIAGPTAQPEADTVTVLQDSVDEAQRPRDAARPAENNAAAAEVLPEVVVESAERRLSVYLDGRAQDSTSSISTGTCRKFRGPPRSAGAEPDR
jgi:hypothetical protein